MIGLGASVLGLYGGGGGGGFSLPSIDLSALATPPAPVDQPLTARDFARMTPWDQRAPVTPLDRLARSAMSSRFLIEGTLGDGPGSAVRSDNDRALFTIHNAVRKLHALADAAARDRLTGPERARIQERVDRGIAEITRHVEGVRLDGAFLTSGKRLPSHTSETLSLPRGRLDTRVLVVGGADAVPEAFAGDRRFALAVTEQGATTTLTIDLAELGATPRTMGAVAGLVNQKLADAGFETRMTRVESSRPGASKSAPPVLEQRFRLEVGAGETLAFEGLDAGADPALLVAGARTGAAPGGSRLTKLVDLAAGGTATGFSADLAARDGGAATIRALAAGPDGGHFAIVDATGPVGNLTPKAARDVLLIKYASTGQQVWSRALGSAAPAQGFALAVGANGTVAVVGAVDGRADNATTTTGEGRDAFMASFDAEGRDLLFHQRGARGADEATHVAVGADGTVYMMGRSGQGMGEAEGLGGEDAWVQAINPDGTVRFTAMLGGAGTDGPAGLVLRDGRPLAVWNEGGVGRMAALDPATGQVEGAIMPTGGLQAVGSVAIDEAGRLFVAGASGGGGMVDTVARLDPETGGALFQVSTGATPVRALTAAGGQVAFAVEAIDLSAGGTLRQSRVKGVSALDGTALFDRVADIAPDGPAALSLEVDRSATLDALGLPAGVLRFGDTDVLTDRTGLRAGDHFFVSVNAGSPRRIDIAQGETFRTLAAKMNRVLGRDGRAEARTASGAVSLVVTPAQGDRVTLSAGRGVADALKQLGLEPGVAMARPPSSRPGARSVSDPPPMIALDLPRAVDLSDKTKAKAAADGFDGVLRRIRLGYREISDDPTMVELRRQQSQGGAKPGGGAGVAYYQAQAAAGQDALRRLGVLA